MEVNIIKIIFYFIGKLVASNKGDETTKGKETTRIEFSFYLNNKLINYEILLEIMHKILPLKRDKDILIDKSIIYYLYIVYIILIFLEWFRDIKVETDWRILL